MTRKIAATVQVSLVGLAEPADGATGWIGTDPDNFDWELFDSHPDEIRYAEFASRTLHYVLISSPDDLD